MNEDFYRFKEVIFGLRYAYIENQKMLDPIMNKYDYSKLPGRS